MRLRHSTFFVIAVGTLLAGILVAQVVPSGANTKLKASQIREGDVRFKVTCNLDRTIAADPIVHPGHVGMGHLHNFFGKKNVDAHTTTYSQLVDGDDRTTCNDRRDLASYWTPGLVTSDQGMVAPSRMTAYFRRGSKNGRIGPYPDGLKIVAGWQEGAPTPPVEIAGWQCGERESIQARQPSPPADCGGDSLQAYVRFPDCWDGVNTDSADHRSHMAYSTYSSRAKANVCPASHSKQVPALTTYVNYTTVTKGSTVVGFDSGGSETLHADFFNGWVRARQLERIDTCLNKLQRCVSGG